MSAARAVHDAMANLVAPGASSGGRATGVTARRLALAAFLVYALTGGGRIVGSDELTMLEVARALPRGAVAVPEGATLRGPDGLHYSKNAAGQAVLAMPLVLASSALARAAGLDPARRELAVRFGVSFFDALVTAILLGVFYAGARRLGGAPGASLGAALLLGFATPLWVYSKSFMAEPLQALGLLLAALGVSGAAAADPREAARAGWIAGLGGFLAVSVKLSMLPLALACLLPLLGDAPSRWGRPALGLGLALAGHALYNVARFGTPLETGYGAQATPAAYSTPLLVGLYGLLLSSGKGVAWFAPPIWLAPRGLSAMLGAAREVGGTLAARLGWGTPGGRAAWSAIAAWSAGLLLYARFQHWAGDGSFGPRYLIPLLPLAFLPVAFALARGGRAVRRLAGALGVIGALVQIGGVAIYFGAQMREAGDYPYTRALEDPRFMSDSHWNPRFSPIAAHWRMLARNARAHLAGEVPRLEPGGGGSRTGLGAADEQAMLRALDFWWLYLVYAGLPRAAVALAVAVLLALIAWSARAARAAWRAEAAAG
jgi:hypothetical protein